MSGTKSAYRGKLPKVDANGYWRPEVGGMRFNIGHRNDVSEGEANRRLNALRDLFDRQCLRHKVEAWEPWLIPFAKRLAKGENQIQWKVTEYARVSTEDAAQQAMLLDELHALGLDVVTDDNPSLDNGRKHLSSWLEEKIRLAVESAVSQAEAELENHYGPIARSSIKSKSPADSYETKTFHSALDAYNKHLEATGARDIDHHLKIGVRKILDRLKYLKEHHSDFPLWEMDLTRIEEHAAYWRNRPITKKGRRCSIEHSRDMNKTLARFLRWLDISGDFAWNFPKGSERISRSPVQFQQDTNQEAFQTISKNTFTPAQLGVLVENVDSFGKALIAICVNCAFGQSEIGQWPTSKIRLFTTHPHAEKVRFKSKDSDSWIVGNRPKTGVYGEHLLWPEVATVVAPFLDGRELFPITDRGTPWYKPYSSNPQAKFGKWWTDVLDRVEKTSPGFPRLPFGSLRDVLPDVIRNEYSDDIASICLQHGSLGEDELLKCYANVPFRKLFNATKELHEYFKPFLMAL